MDLINRTPTPAALFSTSVAEDRLMASVVVRATYRIDGHALVPDHESPWPVDGQPIKTEYGDFDGDTPFRRKGTDLFVLGKAYAMPSLGPGRGRVELQVGTVGRDVLQRDRGVDRAGGDAVDAQPGLRVAHRERHRHLRHQQGRRPHRRVESHRSRRMAGLNPPLNRTADGLPASRFRPPRILMSWEDWLTFIAKSSMAFWRGVMSALR